MPITKRRRTPGLPALCLGAAALLAPAAAQAAEPIRIGLVGPTSGPAANTGLTVKATWELVAAQLNAAGGIEVGGVKRPLAIVAADSQSKPSVGVAAAQRLLSRDGVDLLVGDTLHSDIALALMELSAAYPDKIFYVPLPTSSTIGDRVAAAPEKYGNVWRWNVENTGYGASLAAYLNDAARSGARRYGNKTYAFITEATDFSTTILNAARDELKSSGWNLVASETVPVGSTDFYAQISKVRALAPDVVISIMTTANSGLAYVKQTKEQNAGFDNVAVYYPSLPAFAAGIGSAGNGLVFFSGSFDPNTTRGRDFVQKMTASKINPSGDAVLGYCSATVLMSAIARAKSVLAADINRAMLGTDDDTCPNYWRIVFDPSRHSSKVGPDYAFAAGDQMYDDGKSFFVFYPPKAATRKLDDLPTRP